MMAQIDNLIQIVPILDKVENMDFPYRLDELQE